MSKKAILLMTFAFAFNSLMAQENSLKAGIVLGNIGVQYEQSLSERFSLIGQLGYSPISTTINNVDTRSNGWGYYLEGRYYLSSKKERLEGWHIGPFYNSINTKDDNDLKTNISSIGFATGYQWIFDSQLTLEFIVGLGSLDIDSDKPEVEFLIGGAEYLPHFGISLGYKFKKKEKDQPETP